jgi:hypothetical protein
MLLLQASTGMYTPGCILGIMADVLLLSAAPYQACCTGDAAALL